jgi:hypothetical protein
MASLPGLARCRRFHVCFAQLLRLCRPLCKRAGRTTLQRCASHTSQRPRPSPLPARATSALATLYAPRDQTTSASTTT